MEDIAPAFTASGLTMSSDCGTMAHHNVRVCNLCNLVGFLHWLVGEHDGLPRYMVMVMVIFSALVRSHQSTSPVASASCVPRG